MRDTKHLITYSNKLNTNKKEINLFKTIRKAVNAGANGTLKYVIKKGKNKNKLAQ